MKITKMIGRIGGIFIPFRNIKKLVGWNQFKESTQNIGESAVNIFNIKKKTEVVKETYEQAVKRLNLSQEDIEKRKGNFFKTAILYLVIAAILFVYALNLLFSGMFLATLIALVLIVMAVALAYREHFWYTQMKQQRLGLSFKEWFGYTFKRSK